MAKSTQKWRAAGQGLGMLLLAGVACAGGWVGWSRLQARSGLPDDLPTTRVQRVDLFNSITEDGEVDSTEKTVIECELKRMSFRNGGGSIEASGSSRIIELMPEGRMVKEGDILCKLDSSQYEEMLRQQQIELEEDRAQYQSSKLELETLEVALKEYRDGQVDQFRQQMLGQIALARSELERQRERLEWSKNMNRIGYVSQGQLTSETNALLRSQIDYERAQRSLHTFEKYTAAKQVFNIEGKIEMARAELGFQLDRVERDEKNMVEYQQQVERSTIKAPHDGMLIYANDDEDDERIELGANVREDQDLFYLPNLGKMEVKAKLHETTVARVKDGMQARVRIEALPATILEGTVISVSALPISMRSRYSSDEVKNFEARVELHAVPAGLLPGMSAQVEIVTARKPGAIVVPPEAVDLEEGRGTCFVVRDDGVERREVEVGESTFEWVEVTSGLAEGEAVVLDPDLVEPEWMLETPAAQAEMPQSVTADAQPSESPIPAA